MTVQEFAKLIDHTCLKQTATVEDIELLCDEAWQYRFKCVCINPYFVPRAFAQLNGSNVDVCAVIDFPLGAGAFAQKLHQAEEAIEDGAKELDMVANIGLIKSGQWRLVQEDISGMRSICSEQIILKVIIETGSLTATEIVEACKCAQAAGADFIKTSTGFMGIGATTDTVSLLRKTVGNTMGVKAGGGIRDLTTTLAMLRAGANRIGVSNSCAILNEFTQ